MAYNDHVLFWFNLFKAVWSLQIFFVILSREENYALYNSCDCTYDN